MQNTTPPPPVPALEPDIYTPAEQAERKALGLPVNAPAPQGVIAPAQGNREPIRRRAICAPDVLDEAPDYGSAATGHIVIQDHGSVFWFRNVQVRELSDE